MSAPRIDCDVAVVGAGPAGMAAASVCARAGLATVVFDENPAPGGQIYRGVAGGPFAGSERLGADYAQGLALVEEFRASGARHEAGAIVRSIGTDLDVAISVRGETALASPVSVILATGAIERPFPIPGCTLPGVLSLGGAQSLLKSSALVPSGRTVIAGSGPLVWMVACQLLAVGAPIAAILDTTPRENRMRAAAHLPGFVFSPYLRRAIRLLLAVRGRVPVVRGVMELRASGCEKVESVSYRTADRDGSTLEADCLLLHQGVVPETQLARAAGVPHRWDPLQLCWTPVVDPNGGTAVPGLLIAGDGAGIAGAQAAAWRGVLAGIAVVESIRPDKKLHHAKLARTAIAQFTRGRRFFDTLYQPALRFRGPADDTIACRREEVAEIVAQGRGIPPAVAGHFRAIR